MKRHVLLVLAALLLVAADKPSGEAVKKEPGKEREEARPVIHLPISTSARPIDKEEKDVLFVNVDRAGNLIVSGRPPMDEVAARAYLRQQFKDLERLSKDGKVKTIVMLRADE